MTIIAQTTANSYDYTWLKSALANWLHREDLTARIPEFIALAESEINADMRLRLMEVDSELTLLSGTRTVELPARYSEPIRLDIVFTGRDNKELTYVPRAQMPIETASGSSYEPEYWTINGADIEFPALADRDYALSFRNLQDFDIQTTENNALLTKYPGVYLYGALVQASPFVVKDERVATWAQMYDRIKRKANVKEARTKVLATLRADHPSTRHRSNIFQG